MQANRQRQLERLVELMQLMATQVRRSLPEDWPEVELTMLQFRALMLLAGGPRRMRDISRHTGASFQATTSLVDRLVDRGLVARAHAEDDRRVVLCHLTEQGQREVDRFWHVSRRRIEQLAEPLSDDQLATVVQAMAILVAPTTTGHSATSATSESGA